MDAGQPQQAETVEEFVKRLENGDEEAWEKLHNWVSAKIRSCGIQNDQEVEDLTQECMLAIILSLPALRDRSRFWAWVAGIVKNKVKDFIAKKRRREAGRIEMGGQGLNLDGLPGRSENPANVAEQRELFTKVIEVVLRQLDPAQIALIHKYDEPAALIDKYCPNIPQAKREEILALINLVRALNRRLGLPEMALLLKYCANVTEADIARIIGVSPATVSRWIRRALERLRSHLEDLGCDVGPLD